jgi:adenosine deaminase
VNVALGGGVGLGEDYLDLIRDFDLTYDDVKQLVHNGINMSLLGDEQKQALTQQLDAAITSWEASTATYITGFGW